jgi:hypothetical protein
VQGFAGTDLPDKGGIALLTTCTHFADILALCTLVLHSLGHDEILLHARGFFEMHKWSRVVGRAESWHGRQL